MNGRNKAMVTACIILSFGVAAVLPGQSAEGALALTLEEAVEGALKTSSLLTAERATVDARAASRAQAKTGRYPSLDLEASYMRMQEQNPATIELPPPPQGPGAITLGESVENTYAGTLSVRQPLFTGGEIASRIEAANYAVAASRNSYDWERRGLELEVRTAYWNLLKAELRVEAMAERVRQLEENLENMERRRESGVVTRNEVLTVEMKLAEGRLQLLRARNGRELASTRLALLTGLSPDRQLAPATLLPPAPRATAAPRLTTLIEEALANRGDLAEYRARLEAARAGERSARAGWFPELFIAGEYTYARPNQAIFPPEDEFESSWRIGIVGRVELGDMHRVHHETDQREAELTVVAARLQAAEDHVRLALREAYLKWRSYAEELDLAGTMVRQAEEHLADTKTRVENGVALNEDLLEAEATLLEARLYLTSTRIGARIAWDRLMREAGREL